MADIIDEFPLLEKVKNFGILGKIPQLTKELKELSFDFLNNILELKSSIIVSLVKGIILLMKKLVDKAIKDLLNLKEMKTEQNDKELANYEQKEEDEQTKEERKNRKEEKKEKNQIKIENLFSDKNNFESLIPKQSNVKMQANKDLFLNTMKDESSRLTKNKDLSKTGSKINESNLKSNTTNSKLNEPTNTFNNFLELGSLEDDNLIDNLNINYDDRNNDYPIDNDIKDNYDQFSNRKPAKLSVSTNLFSNKKEEAKPKQAKKLLIDEDLYSKEENINRAETYEDESTLYQTNNIQESMNEYISNIKLNLLQKSNLNRLDQEIKLVESDASSTYLHSRLNNTVLLFNQANVSIMENFMFQNDKIKANDTKINLSISGLDSAKKMERFRHDSTNKKSFDKIGNISFNQVFDIKNNSVLLEDKILEEDTAQINPTTFINPLDEINYDNDNMNINYDYDLNDNEERKELLDLNKVSFALEENYKKNKSFNTMLKNIKLNSEGLSNLTQKRKAALVFFGLVNEYELKQDKLFGEIKILGKL